jgi:hypothetical protein
MLEPNLELKMCALVSFVAFIRMMKLVDIGESGED